MTDCYNIGAGWGLAEITTLGEQTYILNMVKFSPTIGVDWRLIVGPNRKKGDWVDKATGLAKKLKYKIDWYPGEPNDVGGIEKCMVIYKGSSKTAMMDMECGNERNAEHSFICTHTWYY